MSPVGAQRELGRGVEHVGDLAQVRQFGAERSRDARDVLDQQRGRSVIGCTSAGERYRRCSHAGVTRVRDRTRDAFGRVEVPAGRAFEPRAAREREAPTAELEHHANAHRLVVGQVELDPRLERAVDEAQLFGGRLEQHATAAQHAEHLGRVFAAQLGRGRRAARRMARQRTKQRPLRDRHRVEAGERIADRHRRARAREHRRERDRRRAHRQPVLELARLGQLTHGSHASSRPRARRTARRACAKPSSRALSSSTPPPFCGAIARSSEPARSRDVADHRRRRRDDAGAIDAYRCPVPTLVRAASCACCPHWPLRRLLCRALPCPLPFARPLPVAAAVTRAACSSWRGGASGWLGRGGRSRSRNATSSAATCLQWPVGPRHA